MSKGTVTRLRDLGTWSGGNTPSKANTAYWTGGTVPWVSPKDMKVDEIVSSEDHITNTALADGRVSLISEGSVLFVTRSGILAHTFPVAVTKLAVTINQDLKALTPKPGISPKYVAHAVRGASRRILKECSKHGTTVASVDTNALLDFEIPLVNLDEQHRIVAEIEKQFSRLDEAVAGLKRVKANLKRYKAAILKAAVEGRLVPTEADHARREGRNYETGAQLLAGMIQERQAHRIGKGKKTDAIAPKTAGLSELPIGWAWASVEELGRLQLGRQRAPKYHSGANMRPYLRVQNVFEDRIDLSDVMEMDFSEADFERFALHAGDILLNEGQSPELLGRPAMYRGEISGVCFTNTLIRFQAYRCVLPEFALIVFRHYMHAGRFVDESNITTNIAHLSLGRLSTVEFPVPPLPEQHRIVAEVDRLLSIARESEAEVETNLKRAQALRQSILGAAFSG
ncbi:MAG: restriction endonuclease subunit S [Sulfuritalea sp.]|nr:restriction endonuclease subunit S [Sulfuritalea sp.]